MASATAYAAFPNDQNLQGVDPERQSKLTRNFFMMAICFSINHATVCYASFPLYVLCRDGRAQSAVLLLCAPVTLCLSRR